MADKHALASYLVNLHTIMEAQEAMGTIQKSRVLADEYNRGYAELKKLIEDETRGNNGEQDGRQDERSGRAPRSA